MYDHHIKHPAIPLFSKCLTLVRPVGKPRSYCYPGLAVRQAILQGLKWEAEKQPLSPRVRDSFLCMLHVESTLNSRSFILTNSGTAQSSVNKWRVERSERTHSSSLSYRYMSRNAIRYFRLKFLLLTINPGGLINNGKPDVLPLRRDEKNPTGITSEWNRLVCFAIKLAPSMRCK